MKKEIVLYHQNSMKLTREFLLLRIPREVHAMFFTVAAFLCAAAGIAAFCSIDDVIKVNGVVRTQGNVSAVKNVIAGKVTALHYRPGAKVCKGDILYTIDPAQYNAQKAALCAEQQDIQRRLEDAQALAKSFAAGKNLVSPEHAEAYARYSNFCSRAEALRLQKEIAYQNYSTECSRPEVLRRERNIRMERLNYECAASALEACRSEFSKAVHAEAQELQLAAEQTAQELLKLESKYENLYAAAPVDGYVQEIAQLNEGDFLEAGKAVLNIVPDDAAHFRVELQIPPKDIGRIHQGMKVKFRLSAFPYFEYQGAEGKILALDPDIRSSGRELYYTVYADIDRAQFCDRRGRSFPVRAGLETNARIVLEHERLLTLLLKKMDFLC